MITRSKHKWTCGVNHKSLLENWETGRFGVSIKLTQKVYILQSSVLQLYKHPFSTNLNHFQHQKCITQQESSGASNLGWGSNSSNGDKNGSSSIGWGGSNKRDQSSGLSNLNSSFVNVGSSNNNESLPKFSDTFCSSGGGNSFNSFKLNGSSSRRNSSETALFGDPKKKLNWDKIVDKVFKEEIAKLSDTVQNKK